MHSLLAHLTWLATSPWQLLHCAQKTNMPLDLAPWCPVSPHYIAATTEWGGTTPQSLRSSHCNYTLWKSNSVSAGTEKGSGYATHRGEVLGILTRNEVFREGLYHKALQVTNLLLKKEHLWSRTSVLQRHLLAVFECMLKRASQWLQAASFGGEKKDKPCPYSSLGSWDPSLPTKHLPKSWPEGSSEAAFKSKQLSVKALSISTLWRKQRIYCVVWI